MPFHDMGFPRSLLMGSVGKKLAVEYLPNVTITLGEIILIWRSR